MDASSLRQSEIQPEQAQDYAHPQHALQSSASPRTLGGRYQIIRPIGHGTQAKVFEAERLYDHRHVAIKELRIDSLQNWKAYDLFWREVETLKSLNISGVAEFYDVIEQLDSAQPCAYLVQQYISGQSLSDMIHNGYRFDIATVFNIAIQLIDILKSIHHHEPAIIHRDLKPSNIMIEQHDDGLRVYLIDFGAVANPLLQKGGSTVAGTYGYMPPEQLMGKPEPASDIYALGATLAGLLSGIEPSEMEVVEYRLAIEKPLENLPHAIVSCLRQMTQPRVEDRLCDYDIIRNRFEQFATGVFSETASEKQFSKTRKQFSQMLKNVHALGLRDNYDLWNALPESTPRKIPGCYSWRTMTRRKRKPITFFRIASHLPLNNNSIPLRLQPATFIRFPAYTLITIFGNLVILVVLVFSTAFILYLGSCFVSGLIHGMTSGRVDISTNVLFEFWMSYSYILLIPIILWVWFSKLLKYKKPIHKKAYQSLIRNGRKTLATIQSIQYLGVSSINLQPYYLADGLLFRTMSKRKDYSKAYYNQYSADLPMIRVTYAFNPPDDISAMDIVHSVLVPANSEKTLKAGDLLPILYEIDPSDNSLVNSMPFPLSICRPMDIDEMMYVEKRYTRRIR